MAIAFANLGASANPDIADTTNVLAYSNTSWTPPTSGLIICYVWVHGGTLLPGVNAALTGNGITWTAIASNTGGTTPGRRLFLYAANAAGATTDVTTWTGDSADTAEAGCIMSFFQITGADEANGVVQCFVQTPNTTGSGASASITLAAAANANNRAIAGFGHNAVEGTTPRANWTSIDDLTHATPSSGFETQWRTDAFETTASASWTTNISFDGLAAEVRVAQTGPSLMPDIPFIPRGRNI